MSMTGGRFSGMGVCILNNHFHMRSYYLNPMQKILILSTKNISGITQRKIGSALVIVFLSITYKSIFAASLIRNLSHWL